MLNPYMVVHQRQWYRVFTSGFIHANTFHLAFNMIALYSFGSFLEMVLHQAYGSIGSLYYLLLYVLALVVSDLSTIEKHKDMVGYNSLGASGAVSAIVFASVLLNPWGQVLIMMIIPLPGILMAILFILYSYFGSNRSFGDNINHDAHLFGALFGWLFMAILDFDFILYFLNELKNPQLF